MFCIFTSMKLNLYIITVLLATFSLAASAEDMNPTFSPDSTHIAFTRDNDLWVKDAASGAETRLTFDGTETIMNGYASWVYYEEIFGRPSKYRAFWWSPDGKALAFYRFDDTLVPMFPIYSPFGQDGTLRRTHYPKAGERNPEVRIGFVGVEGGKITWADFNPAEDQYFGTPFWGDDSKTLYVSREPRIQNTLDLYAVDAFTGAKRQIYHEEVSTWLDWIDGMLFTDKGLYMVRSFETGWQQIYYLSYDGLTLKRLTDGPNWRIELLRAEKNGTVYFLAERDSHVRKNVYKVTSKGKTTPLSDLSMNVLKANFSEDGKHFTTVESNLKTPWQKREYDLKGKYTVLDGIESGAEGVGELVSITVDGLELPGVMILPKDFDVQKEYPVHVDIYGGPDTPLVHDRWIGQDRYRWFSDNGIIELIADCRASGHNGRAGLDAIYKRLATVEVDDFVEWAKWLQSLPYVRADKIGVEGFSFGGTMTTLLVTTASDYYHYGVAGGGVYDWKLYDTHYTERFMSTPEDNPEGYSETCVLKRVKDYPAVYGRDDVMLKLTHGTADDNVHFQNTLQLIDALQKQGSAFEFMIYPDGMHGYRGYQHLHDDDATHQFWLRYLKITDGKLTR